MHEFTYLKSDLKQIGREPIMLLFALLSLLLILVFKLLVLYGFPMIQSYTGFDVMTYYPYVLALVYLLQPVMLGTVMGFFMLDEKDTHIFELLRVTPMGLTGYLVNRLLLPMILSGIYTVIGWLVLGRSVHDFYHLIWIILFTGLQTVGVGLFIAMVSEDKVKGLTNAKAVSVVVVFAFLDLLKSPLASKIGLLIPQYYVSLAISNKSSKIMFVGLLVNLIWTMVILRWSIRRIGE